MEDFVYVILLLVGGFFLFLIFYWIWEFIADGGISFWEYGICNERQARRHKLWQTVQFGITFDNRTTWYNFSPRYWGKFKTFHTNFISGSHY